MDTPHFVLWYDRQIKVGSEFNPSQFTYACNKVGNDICEKILIDDGGFDEDTLGDYWIAYHVTDDDNISRNQSIHILVGEFEQNDYGFEENDYGFEDISEAYAVLSEHSFFRYELLEKDGTNEGLTALNSPTSICIKYSNVFDSALFNKIPDDRCYFITEKYCDIVQEREVLLSI